jgi:homeobox-leucine zipper protein
MRLKERLEITEEELARLRSTAGSHAVSGDGGDAMGRVVCSGSPSSSFSTGTCQQPGVVGGDHLGDDDLLYVPDYACYPDNSVAEWFSLYGLM